MGKQRYFSDEERKQAQREAVARYRAKANDPEQWKQLRDKYEQTKPTVLTPKERQKNFLMSPKGRAYNLRRGAIFRAKKFNLPFNLSIDWVYEKILTGSCEVTGLPLELITKETYGTINNIQPFSPCIDRIVPELGYVESNCRIVCNIFNQCKMHWTDDDVKTFVKAYYERNFN